MVLGVHTPEVARERVRDLLPGFAVPKQVRRVEILPRNEMGKIDRAEVERLLSEAP